MTTKIFSVKDIPSNKYLFSSIEWSGSCFNRAYLSKNTVFRLISISYYPNEIPHIQYIYNLYKTTRIISKYSVKLVIKISYRGTPTIPALANVESVEK